MDVHRSCSRYFFTNLATDTIDSFSTKRKLQRKLRPNVTNIVWPKTDEGVQILHI